MRRLAHREFHPGSLELLKIKTYGAIAEEVRQEAEAFANEVGPENVLSITENVWMNHFAVVVWYFAGSGE